jgi:hypothetical protein
MNTIAPAPAPARLSTGRGSRVRARSRRRDLIAPGLLAASLMLSYFLYGADDPMAGLLVSALIVISGVIALGIGGPSLAPPSLVLGAATIMAISAVSISHNSGAVGASAVLDRAAPHIAVLVGALGAWTTGYVAGRQRITIELAWTFLVWSALVYCMWAFFDHVGAAFSSDLSASVLRRFESHGSVGLLFGFFALMGSTAVMHVIKRMDAEGLSHSEMIDRLLRDGLGGILLTGFAVTCLLIHGSRVALALCGACMLLQVWWDARSILGRDHRSAWVRMVGRVAPVLVVLIAGGGLALAFLRDETVDRMLAGAADYPRVQRVQAYFDMWLIDPILGQGLGNINAVRDSSMTLDNVLSLQAAGDAQNVLLRWLVETGVVGVVLAGGLLAVMFRHIMSSFSDSRTSRTFARHSVAGGLFLLLHGIAASSLDLPSVVWLFGFVAGAAMGLAASARRKRREDAI